MHSSQFQAQIHSVSALSILDHFTRSEPSELVMGVLLGTDSIDRPIITSTFPISTKDGSTDFNLINEMHSLLSNNDQIVGWYVCGAKLPQNYLEINGKFREYYSTNPCCVLLNTQILSGGKCDKLPLEAFIQAECLAIDIPVQILGPDSNGGQIPNETENYKEALKRQLLDVRNLVSIIQAKTQAIVDGKEPIPTSQKLIKEIELLESLFSVEEFNLALKENELDQSLLLKIQEFTKLQLKLQKQIIASAD